GAGATASCPERGRRRRPPAAAPARRRRARFSSPDATNDTRFRSRLTWGRRDSRAVLLWALPGGQAVRQRTLDPRPKVRILPREPALTTWLFVWSGPRYPGPVPLPMRLRP